MHRGELLHRRSVDQRGREGRSIHMLSDEMHDGLFQHRGGQSPAGEVLLATVLDEAPGDVVAEPLPVFLFGVARRQPVPGLVDMNAETRPRNVYIVPKDGFNGAAFS